MSWDWLVTVVLAAHFTYLAYLTVGGFLAWRWPRAVWPHLIAVGWGILVISFPLICPLTWAEDAARQLAGQTPLDQGFVDRYLDNVIYPERYVGLVRVLVATVIGVSWLGAYLRHRRAARRTIADTPIP